LSKLGQAYTALGFLKRSKVDYMFDGKRYIEFPCFICGEKIAMDAVTTQWECTNCNKDGNIISLDRLLKTKGEDIRRHKIYNPKREKAEIRRTLLNAAAKYNDDKLASLIDKIDTLLEFEAGCK